MKINRTLSLISLTILVSLLTACAGGGQAKVNWPEVKVDLPNDTVYLSAGSFLYSINLSNGAEKWHFPAEADNQVSFYAAPAMTEDGDLILAGYNNTVYSINPATGSENWVFAGAKKSFITSPLAYDSSLFAPSSDQFLYALNLDGSLQWKFETQHALWATPATDGELVYLPSMDHRLYALDIETGNPVWETGDLGGSLAGSPTLSPEGVLYIGTFGSELIALDAKNGSLVWRIPATGWVWSGPAFRDGVLYFGDLNGSLFAVRARDGGVIWRVQPDTGENRAVTGTPLLVDNALYFVSAAGTLYAVNAQDGSPRWNKTFDSKLYFGPYAAGERILIALTSGDEALIALDSNGNQVWAFSPQR